MNIKLSTIMLASLVAFGPALAADKAPAVSKPAEKAVAEKAGADKPVAKPSANVNPFTGKPLTVEQIQRELEESKLRTQMLEEDLKQTNLQQELTTVPLRKAVEAAQAKTALKREDISQKDMEEAQKAAAANRQAEERERAARAAKAEQEAKDAKEASAAAKAVAAKAAAAAEKAAKKPAKKSNSKDKDKDEDHEGDERVEKPAKGAAAAAKPAPVAIRPVLTSIIELNGSRSAVLDFGGNTLVVQDGANTPGGPLKILDMHSADINGEKLKVHGATLSRFVVSDPKPVDPSTQRNNIGAAPGLPTGVGVTTPAVQPVVASGTPAAPIAAGQRTALPPLQLPPGVNVLPSSTR